MVKDGETNTTFAGLSEYYVFGCLALSLGYVFLQSTNWWYLAGAVLCTLRFIHVIRRARRCRK
jgi:hypothetical protein